LISKFNRVYVAGALCVWLLVGCDKGRCVRNSDCKALLTCVHGYCVVEPVGDSSVVSEKDAAPADTIKDSKSNGEPADAQPDALESDSQPSENEEEEKGFFESDLDSGQEF
jgi:hypothetical protein